MKKSVIAVVLAVCLSQTTGFAAVRGTAEYEKLKAYKAQQRQEKNRTEAQRQAGIKQAGPAEKTFWQKEAERSGLAGTGAMFTNGLKAANPLKGLDKKRAGR